MTNTEWYKFILFAKKKPKKTHTTDSGVRILWGKCWRENTINWKGNPAERYKTWSLRIGPASTPSCASALWCSAGGVVGLEPVTIPQLTPRCAPRTQKKITTLFNTSARGLIILTLPHFVVFGQYLALNDLGDKYLTKKIWLGLSVST